MEFAVEGEGKRPLRARLKVENDGPRPHKEKEIKHERKKTGLIPRNSFNQTLRGWEKATQKDPPCQGGKKRPGLK